MRTALLMFIIVILSILYMPFLSAARAGEAVGQAEAERLLKDKAIQFLRSKIEELQSENAKLKAKVAALEKENQELKDMVEKSSKEGNGPTEPRGLPWKGSEAQVSKKPDRAGDAAKPAKGKEANVWDEFRGIQWGAALSKVPEMRVVHREGPLATYARSIDKLSVGEATLTKIWYHTCNDKFVNYSLGAQGYDQYLNLYYAMFSLVGKPLEEGKGLDSAEWYVKTGSGQPVSIHLFYNGDTEEVLMFVTNKELEKERDAYIAERLKKDF